ncbi:MAG: hypothetical protein ACTSU2_09185 [Promethearchaeota archaeon]
MAYFYKLYRKKGFEETLYALSQFENYEAKELDFFKALKDNQSYLNAFYRVKDSMIKHNLIGYRLDEDNNKIIFLTPQGVELSKKIKELEDLLTKE